MSRATPRSASFPESSKLHSTAQHFRSGKSDWTQDMDTAKGYCSCMFQDGYIQCLTAAPRTRTASSGEDLQAVAQHRTTS